LQADAAKGVFDVDDPPGPVAVTVMVT